MKKISIQEEINNFFDEWDCNQIEQFARDIIPLFDIYLKDQEDENWIEELINNEDQINVKLIRHFYLISKIADMHAGKLCSIKANFNGFWKRLEKHAEELK